MPRFQQLRCAADPLLPILTAQTATPGFGPERKRQGRQRAWLGEQQLAGVTLGHDLLQHRHLQLLLQYFALGLTQQYVSGIILTEHVVKQAARRLQLAKAAQGAPRNGRWQQSRHPGNFPELPSCQLTHVHCLTQVLQ